MKLMKPAPTTRMNKISWLGTCLQIGLGFTALYFSFIHSWAHGLEAALTTIELNERTQSVEVIHRLFTHDLEPALEAALGEKLKLDNPKRTDAQIAAYLDRTFALESGDGNAIPLIWIGFEWDGDTTLVYQEIATLDNIDILRIRNALLLDVSSMQINTVNLFLGDIEETLVFRDGLEEQEIPIE